MKKYKIAVIGAGATGLAAAYHASKAGHNVTIFERNNEIGGLAASIDVQGTRLERYYHHLFATDKTFISLAKELGLADKLYFRQLPTGLYFGGKLYDFGTASQMLRFSPIPMLGRVRFLFVGAYLKLLRNYKKLQPKNALKWSRKYTGIKATEVIWEPLLRNKFGKHADSISMAWLWARIHFRTFKLGYMKGGFDQLYIALAAEIAKNGGEILFNQNIKRISQKTRRDPVIITMDDGKKHKFDRVISTTPQPVFAEAIGMPAKNDLWQARYLGATCFILELKKSLVPYYWLNINDPSFPFLAIVEQTHFADISEYNGRHIVYIGNYIERDDWRFSEDPKKLLDKYIPYIKKVSPDFKKSDILKWQFSKAPFAQPIVTPSYHKHIPKHSTPLPHVYLATMSQVYPVDRGQNYALEMGFKVATQALR